MPRIKDLPTVAVAGAELVTNSSVDQSGLVKTSEFVPTGKSDIAVTAADVTLTAAQHQTLYLNLSGVLTGNRAILVQDTIKGFWWVYNGTTGAYTITVKPVSGTGVTVAQGGFACIYSDGSTAVAVYAGPVGAVVGTTDAQTLSSKTIAGGTFTNGYTEETVTANTSTAYTIDLANGTVQILTLTGNCTYTFPTAAAGMSFLLVQKQDGTGSRTVTWPAAVKWPASTAPTLTATASKADLFAFTSDGTNWFGRTIGQNFL